MRFYLVQHAESKPKEEDPERGLTAAGFADIEKTASAAAERAVVVDRIYHSEKKRAVETATVLAGYLKPTEGMSEAEGLMPKDDPEIWNEEANAAADQESIMVVGHLPHMEKLAGLLLSDNTDVKTVSFVNAGIVCLERTDSGWALDWTILP